MAQGSTRAEKDALALLHEFKPSLLFMTGVCGGRKGDVDIGDVLVADKVFAIEGKYIAEDDKTTSFKGDFSTFKVPENVTVLMDRASVDKWAALIPRHVAKTAASPNNTSTRFRQQEILRFIYSAGAGGATAAEIKAKYNEFSIPDNVKPEDVEQYKQARMKAEIWHGLAQRQHEESERVEALIVPVASAAAAAEAATARVKFTLEKNLFGQIEEEEEVEGWGLIINPRAHRGTIATSLTGVRADMSPAEWERLNGERKVFGVEMEGSGLFAAVAEYNHKRVGPLCKAIFAKGVMDFGFEKNDGYKKFAAYASAAWAVNFLLNHSHRVPVDNY